MREADSACLGCFFPGRPRPPAEWAHAARERCEGDGTLLALGRGAGPGALAGEGRVRAAVLGTPRWTDPALAEVASGGGHARAAAAGWQRFGANVLDHLAGSFSLALSDAAEGTLLLATDVFGAYPLVWAALDDGVVFASSVGPLRTFPGFRADLNPQAIFDYLYFHVVPAPLTIYRGVTRLRAGERLLWRAGHADVRRYWMPQFPPAGAAPTVDVATLGTRLREHLADAVGVATADVARESVACFLSGGLDSSTVTGLFARQAGGGEAGGPSASPPAPRAYTMGFDADGFDEMAYARIAAGHFGVTLRERYVDPDEVAEAMPLVARWYDEPYGNSSAVPAYLCARTAAQEGVSRLLAGDGGDELFAGNSRYVRQRLFGHYDRLPGPLRRSLPRLLLLGDEAEPSSPLLALPGLSKVVSYVAQARLPEAARINSYNFVSRYGPEQILAPDWLAQVDPEHPLALADELLHSAPSDDLLQRMLYMDWQLTLADNDLRKVSGMCALAGVEVRYPMLAPEVLALSLQVPPGELIRGYRLRHFYKQAMSGFLPRAIIDKPKQGFGLPFGIWLKQSRRLHDLVFPALDAAAQRGIVRGEFIERMRVAHRDGHASYFGAMLWVITMLELWLAEHGFS